MSGRDIKYLPLFYFYSKTGSYNSWFISSIDGAICLYLEMCKYALPGNKRFRHLMFMK